MNSIILPIVVGILSGLGYGLFFKFQQRRAFSMLANSLFSMLRIAILVGIWFYLLPLTPIALILVLVTFSTTFWWSVVLDINRVKNNGWF